MSIYLNEKPRSNESETAVLSVEAVVVGVEGKVVEKEEPEEEKQIMRKKKK